MKFFASIVAMFLFAFAALADDCKFGSGCKCDAGSDCVCVSPVSKIASECEDCKAERKFPVAKMIERFHEHPVVGRAVDGVKRIVDRNRERRQTRPVLHAAFPNIGKRGR